MRILFALSSLFVASTLCAQAPDAEWRTITTKHFRVHYPAPYEAWSQRAASRLESIRDAVAAETGFAPETTTDIIVENPIAEANGITLPLLDTPRIILYTDSPDPTDVIGNYDDWIDVLAVHEVTHLLHLTRPSRNPLERFSEHFLPLDPITLGAPRWVTEGYATVVEGRITGSGRPNSTIRALILRRWAVTGTLPAYSQLNGNTRFLGMSMAYLVGSAYLEWHEQRAGEGSLRKLWARMTARHRRTFDEAFAGVFGDSPARLYGLFTAELTYRSMKIEEETPAIDGELWQETTGASGDPAVSPDGKSIVLVLRAKMKPSRMVIWSTGSAKDEEEKYQKRIDAILKRDPEDVAPVRTKPLPRKPVHSLVSPDGDDLESPRWTRDGRSILYTHRQPDRDGFLHRDLFLWTPETGANVRITHLADVGDADPLPGGTNAVAVRNRFGKSELVMVNLLTGEVTPKVSGSLDAVYTHPRVAADGSLAVVMHTRENGWRINIMLPGWTETLAQSTPNFTAPEWSGNFIFASALQAGFADIHRLGSLPPITRAPGGAFQPAPSPDGRIFFMSLEPAGYVVRVIPATSTATSPASVLPPAPSPIALAEQPVSTPRDYGIGRQELEPIFGGAYAKSFHAIEAGLRIGDVLGRLDTIVVGSTGDVEGGAISSVWRGWPLAIGAHFFTMNDRYDHHRGIELRAIWKGQWPLSSLRADAGYLASRDDDVPFASAEGTVRQNFGSARLSEDLKVMWQKELHRAIARGAMRIGGYRFAAQAERATGGVTLGGIATTLLPDSMFDKRVLDPALLPQLFGRQYTGVRVEATMGYFTIFRQQHRIEGERIDVTGLEVTMKSPPVPWVKAPGLDVTFGGARTDGTTRWWGGLRWRP